MTARPEWPQWWQWELEISPHMRKRMRKREFNETDLRIMLTQATGYEKDAAPGRWIILTSWLDQHWEVVVEPDEDRGTLVAITAYMVG